MTAMTLEAIEVARCLVMENAKTLISDAELLFDNGRYARAVSLAVLAIEEFAKLPMLARAGTCVVKGIPFDWGRLDKRLRSHSDKLSLLMTFNAMLGEIPTDPAEASEFMRVLEKKHPGVANRNNAKMDGFYVGVENGVPYTPQGIFDKTIAENYIRDAKSVHAFFDHVESRTVGRLAELVPVMDSMIEKEPLVDS